MKGGALMVEDRKEADRMESDAIETERILILRMIESGKITAEEGAKLLEALDRPGGGIRDRSRPEAGAAESGGFGRRERSGWEGRRRADTLGSRLRAEVNEAIRNFKEELAAGEAVQEAAERLQRRVREFTEKDVPRLAAEAENWARKAGSDLNAWLDRLDFDFDWLGDAFHWGWPGPRRPVEEMVEGELPPGDDPIAVEAASMHGRVTVQAWEGPGYRVFLEGSAAEGRSPAGGRWLQVDADGGALRIGVPEGAERHVRAQLTVELPVGRTYRLAVRSVHGRVELKGLRCDAVEAKTTHGRVRAEALKARSAEFETKNGSIVLRGVEADESIYAASKNGRVELKDVRAARRVEAESKNGRIEAEAGAPELALTTRNGSILLDAPAELLPEGDAHWALETKNGEVAVRLPERPDVGVRVSGRAGHGRLRVGHRRVEASRSGPGEIEAATPGFESCERRIHLDLETHNGQARLEGSREPEAENDAGEAV